MMNEEIRTVDCPKCQKELKYVSGFTFYGSLKCDECDTHMNIWGQEILPPSEWKDEVEV